MARFLNKTLLQLEKGLEHVTRRVEQRLFAHDHLTIHPYRSYGNDKIMHLRGRVLEDEGILEARATDSIYTNLRNMIRRIESDEIANVGLRFTYGDYSTQTLTDEEGYYDMMFEVPTPELNTNAAGVKIEVTAVPEGYEHRLGHVANQEVVLPTDKTDFGVISDIDDTIMRTGATRIYRMAYNTFLKNDQTRSPLEGAAEFYQQLKGGQDGTRDNMFFYVSSSPWNIYDFLVQFMRNHDFPVGPLLLKDYGFSETQTGFTDHLGHKYREISRILQTYPDMEFILVGDSGQKDPFIYQKIVEDFPGRIMAVLIHSAHRKRHSNKVKAAIEAIHERVPTLLLDDVAPARDLAEGLGWVPPSVEALVA